MTTWTASFPPVTMGPLQPPAGMVGCGALLLPGGPDQRLETAVTGKGSLAWVLFSLCSLL